MLRTVVIAENALDPETWVKYEDVENVLDFLLTKFEKLPENARIYHNEVAESCDVTPNDEHGIEKLGKLAGTIILIVYPGDLMSLVNVGVAALGSYAISAITPTAPQVPNATIRNTQSESPNNGLSDRKNDARLNSRIPDIYGTVRSTPDLLAVPYRVYVNHEEVEFAYMCVGRGDYDISAGDVYDDNTLISEIAGATVEVFAPDTSPNSGDAPQLRIGTAISEPLYSARRSNAINGQVLRAPNGDSVAGNLNIRFANPDKVELISGSGIDFTEFFAPSDSLTITDASFTGTRSVDKTFSVSCNSSGVIEFELGETNDYLVGDSIILTNAGYSYTIGTGSVDLDGTYTILSKTSVTITLDNPVAVNADWGNIAGNFTADTTGYEDVDLDVSAVGVSINLNGTYTIVSVASDNLVLSNPTAVNIDWYVVPNLTGAATGYISPILETGGSKWVGPFTFKDADLTKVFSNFVALNGLYKDDGNQQIKFDVVVELEITPIDANGTPTGAAETFQGTLEGSAKVKSTRALTIKAAPTFSGFCEVRARRVTDADLDFAGNVVDEVKWKELYSISPVSELDFGNVTTVHSVTYATAGALAVKNRKLNMVVSRKLPTRISGSTFTVGTTATNRADEIISSVCLDERIGNRTNDEVDFDNIYDTIQEVEDYFGTSKATEFSYTIDSNNLSFEEIISSIASAVHCQAYREGSTIKISFEKETENSTLLFNHRNKLPGSESRSLRFGNEKNHDGLEYEYIDPTDDSIETFYIPSDKSAINPKKVETIGIRSKLQAHFHAWRAWNKIRYQRVFTEFDATQEADLAVISDRILVSDNTRPNIQDGEVLAQNVLELTLSQEVALTVYTTYEIFLQHVDGSVESIGITAGSATNKVILANAPRATLALDPNLYAVTTYLIVGSEEVNQSAFLVTEKQTRGNFTSTLSAVNYDSRYYEKDLDFENGIVDIDGNLI
jgi:hypothetical protein